MRQPFLRISDIRNDNDDTQQSIANILKVARASYSNWENGYCEIPIKRLVDFANYYNINIDYILCLSDIKETNDKYYYNIKELSTKLRRIRKEHENTQEQIATILNISQKTYADYENGKVKIPLSALIKFCRYYDTSPSILLKQ